MNKYISYFFLGFVLFSSLYINGQYNISGRLADTDGQAVPYANVILSASVDSLFITGTSSSEEGIFTMEVQESRAAFLQISSLGYEDYYSPVLPPGQNHNLGTIFLEPMTENLSEVVLTSKKKLYEVQADRTVVNVQSSPVNAGNTILSVLGRSPSVIVNRNTNQISLMGRQGILVMVNNKPLRMNGNELFSYLESLNADTIETIELITSPPANYDAQGIAGIININTTQHQALGFRGNSSSNMGYGETAKYGTNLSLDYIGQKLHTWVRLSSQVDNALERVDLQMDYATIPGDISTDMVVRRNATTKIVSGDFGFDYELSNKTRIGALIGRYHNRWEMDALSTTVISPHFTSGFIEEVASEELNRLKRTLVNVNLNHDFSKTTSLNLDYDHIYFKRNNPTEYLATHIFDESTTTESTFLSNAETPITINVIKADLMHAFSSNLTLETGLKTTNSKFENTIGVSYLEDGQNIPDPDFTDKYILNEKIHAGFLFARWVPTEKITGQAGARFEYYELHLSSEGQGKLIDMIQRNVFTNFNINYKPNDNNEWTLAFNQRIDRPGFLNLAPYLYFFNTKTLFTGNASLVPTKSYQFNLNYRWKTLHTSMTFSDAILPIFDYQPVLEGENEIVVFRPQQGHGNQNLSLFLSFPKTINSWWNGQFSAYGNYLLQTPIVNQQTLRLTRYSYIANLVNTFKINETTHLEIIADYNSSQYGGIAKTLPRTTIDVGAVKEFKKGVTLSANISDVFNSGSEWNIVSNRGMVNYNWLFDAEGPVFRIGLTIPFGTTSATEKLKRASGSEEEQQRLN